INVEADRQPERQVCTLDLGRAPLGSRSAEALEINSHQSGRRGSKLGSLHRSSLIISISLLEKSLKRDSFTRDRTKSNTTDLYSIILDPLATQAGDLPG